MKVRRLVCHSMTCGRGSRKEDNQAGIRKQVAGGVETGIAMSSEDGRGKRRASGDEGLHRVFIVLACWSFGLIHWHSLVLLFSLRTRISSQILTL